MFDDHAFEQIRDVLTAVGGILEEVQQLFPFDHDDRIALFVEERDDGVLVHAVGFALELIDARAEFDDTLLLLVYRQRFAETVGCIDDDLGQPASARPDARAARKEAREAAIRRTRVKRSCRGKSRTSCGEKRTAWS